MVWRREEYDRKSIPGVWNAFTLPMRTIAVALQRSTVTNAIVILLTAFGIFPGTPVNATAVLVPRLARRLRREFAAAAGDHTRLEPVAVHTMTLPTEWRRGPDRAEAAVRRLRPDLVVHFGVSQRATGFVLETCARSACHRLADACGAFPAEPLLGRPATLKSSLPMSPLRARLAAAGLPVTTSDDAGGYLCNAVLYRTLGLPPGVRPTAVGFVHIPASLAGQGAAGDGVEAHRTAADGAAPGACLDQRQFLKGAAIIVDHGLGFIRQRASAAAGV